MVDGADVQAELRRLVSRRLAEVEELRDAGLNVEREYKRLAVCELCVNADAARDVFDQVIAGGS